MQMRFLPFLHQSAFGEHLKLAMNGRCTFSSSLPPCFVFFCLQKMAASWPFWTDVGRNTNKLCFYRFRWVFLPFLSLFLLTFFCFTFLSHFPFLTFSVARFLSFFFLVFSFFCSCFMNDANQVDASEESWWQAILMLLRKVLSLPFLFTVLVVFHPVRPFHRFFSSVLLWRPSSLFCHSTHLHCWTLLLPLLPARLAWHFLACWV